MAAIGQPGFARTIRKAVHEPLVHFLALGLALFLLFGWRGSGSNRIVVTTGRIEHLAAGFARTWQRPPAEAELKALIDDYVKEEIATREAVAAGLDRDDTIVRRRLRQKVEFLVEDTNDEAPPTDVDLRAWLERHPDAFRGEPVVALRQVFVSRNRTDARSRAGILLARLRAAGPLADAARFGDPTALPGELQKGPAREVSLVFGEAFARAVERLPAGEWSGPVESAYGLHLVLVLERDASSRVDLAEIRPQVEREVIAERRRKVLEELYGRLLAKYSVSIEKPPPPRDPAVRISRGGR